MTRHALPSPALRLRRQPLALVGLTVVLLTAVSLGRVQTSAGVSLAATADANFRGSYDLLVRPATDDLRLAATRGLVEQDFLGLNGSGGITMAQLGQIRAQPGVSLAAPIAVVGYVKTLGVGPCVYLQARPSKPTLYRYDLTATTTDGVRPILVQREHADVLVPAAGSKDQVAASRSLSGAATQADGSVNSCFEPLPTVASPVVGVDPPAERQLLGPSASFLDAFSRIEDREHLNVSSIEHAHVPEALFPFGASDARTMATSGPGTTRPVVPVLVSARLSAPLTLSVHVTQQGAPLPAMPAGGTGDPLAALQTAARLAGPGTTDQGTSTLDVTQKLVPFTPVSLELSLPGSGRPAVSDGFGQSNPVFDAQRAQRPAYTTREPRPGSSAPAFSAAPQGFIAGEDDETTPLPAGVAAGQQSYRALVNQPSPFPDFTPTNSYDKPFAFAPIGRFDLSTLELPTNKLDYVPLGVYDQPNTALVADAAGTATATPTPLSPTLNPQGFLTGPPLAITDLLGGQTLRGSAPIDAVRVRLSGITGFNAESRQRLVAAALAIGRHGLHVDVVAGSSPQAVEVYLPQYRGNGPGSDLGWARQEWTTLGATARVASALGGADRALLGLGLALCVVFLGCLQSLRLTTRTRDVALLRAGGLSAARVQRWYLAESGTAVAVLAAVLGLASLALRPGRVAVASWVLVVALVPLFEAAAVAAALRSARRAGGSTGGDEVASLGRRGLRRTVRSPSGYGLRQAVARRTRTVVFVLAGVMSATAAGLAVAVLSDTSRRSGPTLLAADALTRLRPYAIALFAIATVGGVALTATTLSVDLRDRRGELQLLVASGWGARHIRVALRVQRLSVAPAVVPLAVVTALILARGLAPQRTGVAGLSVGVAAVLWLAATSVSTARSSRGAHRS